MSGFDATGRATTILITILGYDAFLGLDGDHMENLVAYVQSELEIIATHGAATPKDLFAAPDCREMKHEDRAKALPGLITWAQLKAGSEHEFNWAE